MERMILDVPGDIYILLEKRAATAGKKPETITLDILKSALRRHKSAAEPVPRSAREILQSSGRSRPLSDALRQRIIPGVTLEEVQASLARADGPSLSEIIVEQRERRDA
jgi:hypothetical protein